MATVYIVMGTTGQYSDRREWAVKAFMSKVKAEDWVVKASDAARECAEWTSPSGESWRYVVLTDEEQLRPRNPFDPNMEMDYTGTSYHIIEAELDETE